MRDHARLIRGAGERGSAAHASILRARRPLLNCWALIDPCCESATAERTGLRRACLHGGESVATPRLTAGPRSPPFETRVCCPLCSARSRPVLFVADLFHPVDGLAIETFHDGDVRHGGGCGGAVPMLLAGRAPDDVTGSN